MKDLEIIDKIDTGYKDHLYIKLKLDKEYIILTDEEKSIIYRSGNIEAGGNFKVYRKHKGIWSIENEGFGSPTSEALYIGDISNILNSNTKYNIINLVTGEVVIHS